MTDQSSPDNGALEASEAFGRLARLRLADHTLDDVMELVASLAKRTLPGASEVSVTFISDGRAVTAAYTGPLAISLDEIQYDKGYGPCLDAASNSTTISITDMTTEDRWPAYVPEAVKAGALSSLSVPVPVQQEVTAALNIYATTPHAFDDESVANAEKFASYAAVAIGNAHLFSTTAAVAAQMREAMLSRAVIEQAKGILMAVHSCDADAAFAILTKESQHKNRKLREVAADIVATATGRPANRRRV